MHASNLSAAAEYVGEGLDILPLTPLSKIPLKGTSGVKDASDNIDPWETDNNYNIGMACGASGIVVIDFDFRNGAPPVDSLFDDDDLHDVVIVDTPSGGVHLWFKQPDDIIGCPKSTVAGIDIKGSGGYVVVPPSKVNGKHYTFRSDHELTEIPLSNLAVLPQHIIDILIPKKQEWARTDSAPIPTDAEEIRARLACIPPLGTYDEWLEILMAVHSAYPDEVGIQLCEEWSPGKPGEIAKKFASFRKGGRGIGTLIYLSNQHGYQAQVDQDVRAKLTRVKQWVGTEECVSLFKLNKVTRVSQHTQLLLWLVDTASEMGTYRIRSSYGDIAKMIGVSRMSVLRRIHRMEEMGLLSIVEGEKGQLLDLSPLSQCVSVTEYLKNGETVTLTHSNDFVMRHIGDDAFRSYPYVMAVKRRGGVSPLMTSLGDTALLLWDRMVDGGTVKEIAAASGLSTSSVRHSIKKMLACGLLDVDDSDKEVAYVLKANAEELLDGVRPHMVTYHVGQMTMGKSANAAANYANFRLRKRAEMTPREVMWWQNMRDDNDRTAALIFDNLMEQGFDARMKVGKEKAVRTRSRYDWGEEWRTWGRPLFDAYNALGSMSPEEKIVKLTLANTPPESSDNWFTSAKFEMGQNVRTMLAMSVRRVRYERTAPELQEDIPHTEPQQKLQIEMELT